MFPFVFPSSLYLCILGVLDMAIQFQRKNLLPEAQQQTETSPAAARPKTQFWINVGYSAGEKFVSVPLGIPLDNVKEEETQSKNADYRALKLAQNDLLEQIRNAAEQLDPGQGVKLKLEVELRRIEDGSNNAQVTDNPYSLAHSIL